MPYYHAMKVALLLWLQLPRFEVRCCSWLSCTWYPYRLGFWTVQDGFVFVQGAARLYRDVLSKQFGKIQPSIDKLLDFVSQLYSSPIVAKVEGTLQAASSHIPILEWFMRRPDGEPVKK